MSFKDEIKFAIKMLDLTGNVNVLFSPVSVLSGFSLIYFNTKNNETETKLAAEFFEKDGTKDEIIEYFSKFTKQSKNENAIFVNFVIKLFVSDKCELAPDFRKTINTKFNGEIHEIKEENSFMKNATYFDNNSRRNLLLFTDLNFASPWENSFNKAHMQIFYSNPPREIKFMSKIVTADFNWNFVENENWISLGISYQNFEAWMYIVLPKENYSLTELIKTLSIDSFKAWTKRSQFPENATTVTIPLFTVSTNIKFKEICKKMGLNNIFSDDCDGAETDMKFDNFIHTSSFSINESGTQSNSNIATKLARNSEYASENKVTADRPFLYFIISNEKTTDKTITVPLNLLFVGTFY